MARALEVWASHHGLIDAVLSSDSLRRVGELSSTCAIDYVAHMISRLNATVRATLTAMLAVVAALVLAVSLPCQAAAVTLERPAAGAQESDPCHRAAPASVGLCGMVCQAVLPDAPFPLLVSTGHLAGVVPMSAHPLHGMAVAPQAPPPRAAGGQPIEPEHNLWRLT